MAFKTGIEAPQDFMDGILPQLMGAHPDHVKHSLLITMRDFFSKTSVWTEELPPFNTVVGQQDYPLVSNNNTAEVWAVAYAWGDSYPIMPLGRQPVFGLTKFGSPIQHRFTCPAIGSIRLVPIPTNVFEVTVVGVLVPISLDLPDSVRSEFYEPIVEGTLGRLMIEPNKPYTDTNTALYYKRRYTYLRQTAQIAALQGRTDAAIPWSFPRFGK